MKIAACFYLFVICCFSTVSEPARAQQRSGYRLSFADVARILGQPARLTDSTVYNKNGATDQLFTYTTVIDKDTSHLYYRVSKHLNAALAHADYNGILTGNRNMPGLKTLTGLGDEALFHTDGQHFDLLIVRQADRLFVFKVSKITAKTSVDEMKKVAARLAGV